MAYDSIELKKSAFAVSEDGIIKKLVYTKNNDELLEVDLGAGGISPAEALLSGSALFVDSAGNAAQDNDNFYWDADNNRLILRNTGEDQTGRDDGAIGAPLHFQRAWAPLDRNARWPFTMAGPTGNARALIGLTNEPGNTQPDTIINVRTAGSSGRLRLTKDSDATSWWFSINRDRIVEAPADANPGLRVLGKGLTLVNTPAVSLLVTGDELILAQQGAAHTSVVMVAGDDAAVHRPVLRGTRSRGTLAAPTPVVDGDRILDIAASGYDGIEPKTTAMIVFDVAGAVVPGSVPARINFITSASTPGARVERVSIPHNLDGFTFGALRDTVLYRSLANTLRTDDDFNVNGLTTVAQSGFIGLTEMADPAIPGANRSRIYCRDNGAGKTQVVVVFPTGAVQVLATEP